MPDVRVQQGNSYLAECIASARERVVLVSFMLTSLSIVGALCKAARSGCRVSVLTLPSDMVRTADAAAVDRVRTYHEELLSQGRFAYADLEIGDPRRTTTSRSDVRSGEAVGRKWYALHAKFLVVDQAIVMTSANCGHDFAGRGANRTLVDEDHWEVHWHCQDERLAEEYVAWHQRLAELLNHDSPGRCGSLSARPWLLAQSAPSSCRRECRAIGSRTTRWTAPGPGGSRSASATRPLCSRSWRARVPA